MPWQHPAWAALEVRFTGMPTLFCGFCGMAFDIDLPLHLPNLFAHMHLLAWVSKSSIISMYMMERHECSAAACHRMPGKFPISDSCLTNYRIDCDRVITSTSVTMQRNEASLRNSRLKCGVKLLLLCGH